MQGFSLKRPKEIIQFFFAFNCTLLSWSIQYVIQVLTRCPLGIYIFLVNGTTNNMRKAIINKKCILGSKY